MKNNLHVAERLAAVADRERVAHAYIFAGPEGIGKRATALQFARDRVCRCGACPDCSLLSQGKHPHVILLTPTEDRVTITIRQAQELHAALSLRPDRPLARVVIIDPADAMSTEAMNSMLKLLEEPPARVTFILITTLLMEILPTVRSRCHTVRFYPVSTDAVREHLRQTAALAPADVELVSALCGGSFGEADRLAKSLDETRQFVRALLQSVHSFELSTVVETLIKSKEAAETRNRARLAFRILALACRDSMRGEAGPFGSISGSPDRLLRAIEALMEHEVLIDRNAHSGLVVADALLQVAM